MRERADARSKKPAPMRPRFEHITTGESESFLWRMDDYPRERNVWNFHPECEIHLIRNASGVALIGDHIGQFEPGHLAVVGGGLPHDWITTTAPGEVIAGRDIVLQFDPERWRRAASDLPELAQLEPLLVRARRGVAFKAETRRAAAEILEAIGAARGVARLALFVQLLGLLAQSSEFDLLSSESFAPDLDNDTLDIVQKLLAFSLANFDRDVRIGELAAMADMSETAFSRFFKKNTGNAFTDHITKLRIGRACKLLAETEKPVTDICFEVGYANISNFNRNFRNHRALTPSAYRRLAQARLGLH